jgi:trk system potassium uptake protein
MALTVLIVGGGRVGATLGRLLPADDHQVTLVEAEPHRAAALVTELPVGHVVPGDGTDPVVLEAAGARTADVVVAVTDRDATNLIVTSLARHHFGVPRTIARIVDPRHAWLFSPVMGVDVAVDQADLIARLVAEEMSLGQLTTLLALQGGRFALIEERIAAGAAPVGRAIADLDLPPDCAIVAVVHDGEVSAADPATRLAAGDEVLAVVGHGSREDLRRRLG